MKKNLWNKIVILLVMFFFIIPLLSPAQELSKFHDDMDFKVENNTLLQQRLESINPDKIIIGEKLDSADYDLGYVEDMDACIARDMIMRATVDLNKDDSRHGIWVVPPRGASYYPHSGIHNVVNKWGDTMMGISFPSLVDVHGAWFAGQGGGKGVWTKSIRVIGYRNGEHTKTTDWFEDIDDTPSWFAIYLEDVDRIVIEASPVFNGAGWYAMDDLTYTPKTNYEQEPTNTIVLDFEDCYFKQNLNTINYAGLEWETGTGNFKVEQAKKSVSYISSNDDEKDFSVLKNDATSSNNLEPIGSPILLNDYQGVIRGDATSWSYPPDSCGAAGPNHFVEVVNRNFAVYNKSTGEELINILLGAFLPESNGDPRVLYDQYSDRWFIIVCDFNTKLFLAVSKSSDPTGSWFKCSFVVSEGSDQGKWPDYPTLGVDEDGIYTAAYMIGGSSGMSIFALEKAPLIDEDPSLGDIYAFRELTWEGAIQPVHTFGTTEGEYFVSRGSSTTLRVRVLTGLLSTPVLTELGFVNIPSHSEPPDAPALGSTVPLDTVGHRLMNAVYRDGYIWTAHCIDVGGRAASRWYKINVLNTTLDDYGTIEDPVLYYFFPTIMVNPSGDVIMGFSGSCSGQYAAAYYTGRSASDPPGYMAPPVLYKEGEATYNLIDSYGRNRWGDYSLCSLDPVKNTLWTIQEYAHSHNESDVNRWGTWICELVFNQPPQTPTKPDGPEILGQFAEATFSTSAIDPEGEDVYYKFNWGDGTYSEWVGPYSSGETGEASHSWADYGEFEVKAIAKDINDIQSEWSEPAVVTIIVNEPPEKVTINGPSLGLGGKEYEYTFISTDPEGQDIYYKIDWDDGQDTGWLGPFSSGEQIKLSHSWNKKGGYWIKAWAKDIYESCSNQGMFKMTILKNKAKSANIYNSPLFVQFFEKLISRFPILTFLLN
ncbi:hypothetical protein AYK20_02640 [Thermoplasmatales archaeon SG8-52-1]|nr:MAG: hypothetical protein AYK20_02640 [Thermoplasmatales archaeon SG8-52-1]